jgi:hypothetical protein
MWCAPQNEKFLLTTILMEVKALKSQQASGLSEEIPGPLVTVTPF